MKKIFIYGQSEHRANYIAALAACGLTPVVSWDQTLAQGCHGLLLPGGGDLDPALFGQENQGSRGVDPDLDRAELGLVAQFSGRPILGICRGLQVLNVAFGGTLVQDLPTAAAHRWEESTGDKAHRVTAGEGFLREIYGEEFFVNSAHHQGAGQVAKGFQVAALAGDGVVEALACPERRVFAVQWHPERMTLAHARPDTVDGLGVFRFFAGMLED